MSIVKIPRVKSKAKSKRNAGTARSRPQGESALNGNCLYCWITTDMRWIGRNNNNNNNIIIIIIIYNCDFTIQANSYVDALKGKVGRGVRLEMNLVPLLSTFCCML